MKIVLNRDIKSVNSTTGKLSIDGEFQCFVLEDEDRGLNSSMSLEEIIAKKVPGQTCIPQGEYKVIITHSNRFNRDLPLLVNVPGYDGIRIHPGNTAADTEGCLLPGEARSVDTVLNSRSAWQKLFDKIKAALDADQEVTITIE